jgi:hypothetical protein
MPFNGSGVFVRNYSWVADAAASIPITATRMDADTNDITLGLTDCITRDGQSTAMANIPMGGFTLTNIANASANNQPVAFGQANTLYNAKLGYTPVQQGTGVGQGTNAIKIGWNVGTSKIKITVDSTDMGNIALETYVTATYAPLVSPSITGTANFVTIVASGNITGNILTASSLFQTTSTNCILANSGSGSLFFRPVGNTGTNQMSLASSGILSLVDWTLTSDANLKKDFELMPVRSGISRDLNLYAYRWITSGEPGWGPTAQEVQSIAPEYVTENTEGNLTVNKLALVFEMIRDLSNRVDYLEEKIERLGGVNI